jgi:hypothetical protein
MPITLTGNTADITIGSAALYVAPVGITLPTLTGHESDFAAFLKPGYTNDGIEWDYQATFYDIKVDEVLGIIKKKLVSHKLTMTTKLSQANLQNLALACAGATFNGTDTVTFGSIEDPPEYVIGFIGEAPSGKTRYGLVYRSVSMGASKIHYHKKTEITYGLTLEAMVDSTQLAIADLATYRDF